MDADYTGKHVAVTTTTGAKYRGILQNLNISNGTITINNISQLQPPYTVYPPTQLLSFAGNDLTELNFIDDVEEPEPESESEVEEEDEEDEIMKQQEQFQKELEAMRSKSKKENQGANKEKNHHSLIHLTMRKSMGRTNTTTRTPERQTLIPLENQG